MVFNHFSITQLSFTKYSAVRVNYLTDRFAVQRDNIILYLLIRVKRVASTHQILERPYSKAVEKTHRQAKVLFLNVS